MKQVPPAHKHVGDEGKPGQIVTSPKAAVTLGDYLEKKYPEDSQAPAVKLTYKQWVVKELQRAFPNDANAFNENNCLNFASNFGGAPYACLERLWKAAQENV